MRLMLLPERESVELQRIMKIKLRSGSGKIGGSVCKINVWRKVKMDESEGRHISCFSEVETVLIKRTHISLSGHVKA